jgi:hypothetical protein
LILYRQAWGLPEDSVMYQSAAREQQQALRTQLEQALAEKDSRLKLLEQQLETLQKPRDDGSAPPRSTPPPNRDSNAEVEALKKWIAQLEAERAASRKELAALPQLRTPAGVATLPSIGSQAEVRSVGNLSFGRYYALVIGNQHYQIIESLKTPLNDAERAALPSRYSTTRAMSRCSRRSTTSTMF